VLDATMRGNTTALSLGIRYAVDNGAQILNVSINGDESSSLLEDAVRYASDRGATIVASAGNNARNLDLVPSYPAVLPNPAMLTVAATDPTSRLASISNFGPQSVELGAPGEHILSTALGSGYEMRVGTSMAAPFVSGSLALLAAARPDLGQSELRTALLATVRRPAALISKIQDGTLDVGAAMARLAGVAPAVDAAAGESAGPRLRTGKRTRAGRRATLRWSAGTVQDVSVWRVSLDRRVVARVKVGATLRVQRRIERAGQHRWRVVGLDASAAKLTSSTRDFRVIARR
jgi:subtilisin family serine protease